MLINFCGKSGSGKSTLSKAIARQFHAVYLEMDTVDELLTGTHHSVENIYTLLYGLSKANLLIGNMVVSDAVSHNKTIRNGWNQVVTETKCSYLNIEVICSDDIQRRSRLEERGNKLGFDNWNVEEIMTEPWEDWDEPAGHIIIDTANNSIEECIIFIADAVREKLSRIE
jgi:predicted kinase